MALDTNDRDEPTLGQLVAAASKDLSTIVRGEVELAKAEVTGALGFAAKGVPMLAVAAVLALYALGFLLTAGARGLESAGLAGWAAYLVVAVVLLLLAGGLALAGRSALAKVQPKPERAIAVAEATIATLKREG